LQSASRLLSIITHDSFLRTILESSNDFGQNLN
jgi:hypothetical protein